MKYLMVPLLVIALSAVEAEPKKLLESLRTELHAELKAQKKTGKEEDNARSYRFQSVLSLVPSDDALTDGRMSQVIQSLEQIRAVSISDKVDEICKSLIAELRELTAQRSKDLKEKFDTTLRSALESGLKATSAKDVDMPLTEVVRLQKELQSVGYREDGRSEFNANALQAVQETLTAIQDGLIAVAKPQGKRNRDPAERLQSAVSSYSRQLGDLMPRSEFLEKISAASARIMPNSVKALTQQEFEKQSQTLILSVKKLDDLGDVLAKIDEISSQQRELNGYYGDSNLTSQLRSYRHTYDDLRTGGATSLSFASSSYSNSGTEILNGIKSLLVKFALTRVLNAPEDLAPKEEESVATFLQRALETARATSNWPLLARVLDAAQTMNLASIANSNDTMALRQFLGGVNLERAHQYSGAVSSYLAALKTGSQVIPVDKIGETLAILKKEHPQEYEAGINPPISYMEERMARMSSFQRPGMGSSYPPGANPPNTTLAVPAVTSDKATIANKPEAKQTTPAPKEPLNEETPKK